MYVHMYCSNRLSEHQSSSTPNLVPRVFHLPTPFPSFSENLRVSRRNTWDTGKYRKLEPVSSTPRRGARGAYHDEYPQDFGPRIAYIVSKVSDTSQSPIRQGGREMSLSFTSSVHILRYQPISICIQNCRRYFFHAYVVFTLCLETLYICHLCVRSSKTTNFKVQRHFEVILSSMWYVLVGDTARQFH